MTSAAEPSNFRRRPKDQSALIRRCKAVNESEMFGQDNELTFVIDRAARVVVVRMVNRKTGDVVEQIPSGSCAPLGRRVNSGRVNHLEGQSLMINIWKRKSSARTR